MQHGSRVGAAAPHSRPAGDVLADVDGKALPRDAAALEKVLGRPKGGVLRIYGKVLPVAEQPDARLVDPLDLHLVPHRDTVHHGVQGVIAVLPAPCDIQGQVDLCVCLQFHRSLRSVLPAGKSPALLLSSILKNAAAPTA